MREGELIALTWGDVDLTGAVARVRRTCTDGIVQEPKNHEQRDVDLTPEVVDMLGQWWGELGSPADDQLVFPGDGRDGYLVNGTILKRELYPAMERAGVPASARPPRSVPSIASATRSLASRWSTAPS